MRLGPRPVYGPSYGRYNALSERSLLMRCNLHASAICSAAAVPKCPSSTRYVSGSNLPSGPGDEGGEKALHGAIAAAVCGPAGDAEHGDATGHGQHAQGDAAELADGRHRDLRLEAEQEW